MCIAVIGKIMAVEGLLAAVDINGLYQRISIYLLPDAQVGEEVLIHAGFAIQRVAASQAVEETILLKEAVDYVFDEK